MKVTDILPRGLVVSCQALKNEPLHDPLIMGKMALAAKQGGAIGIRANSYVDILEIKQEVELPVIGIVKREYRDSPIYITPTIKEIDEIAAAGAEIIALDATSRKRPGGETLESFVQEIRRKYPEKFIMADISNYEEGLYAESLGFDLISTTLSGYTEYTKDVELPNMELIEKLTSEVKVPVIAEGGIWTIEQLDLIMQKGVYAVVIGSAITRPKEITKRFVRSMQID